MSEKPTAHCAFCGHVSELTNLAMAEHVVVCEKHPLHAALKENAHLRAWQADVTATIRQLHADNYRLRREAEWLRMAIKRHRAATIEIGALTGSFADKELWEILECQQPPKEPGPMT